MNPAVWVERHGRRRRDEPALAERERVHTTWVHWAARTASVDGWVAWSLGVASRK